MQQSINGHIFSIVKIISQAIVQSIKTISIRLSDAMDTMYRLSSLSSSIKVPCRLPFAVIENTFDSSDVSIRYTAIPYSCNLSRVSDVLKRIRIRL